MKSGASGRKPDGRDAGRVDSAAGRSQTSARLASGVPSSGAGKSRGKRAAKHAARPKWKRRAEARPGEIVAAAYRVFCEKGFAAAKLDDIAAEAGVSKGALYLYFEDKQAIFEAVIAQEFAANFDTIEAMAKAYSGEIAGLVRAVAARVAEIASVSPMGKVLKLVVAESGNFPELARVWHDRLVARGIALVSGLIRRGQKNGEFRKGDPRYYALTLISPLVAAVLFRETFEPVGGKPINLPALMNQHVDAVLGGLLLAGPKAGRGR